MTTTSHSDNIAIRRIDPTRRNLLPFVKFPITLYTDTPYYVPPLVIDEVNTLRPDKNPAFDFCRAAYFIAERNGKIVGRIAAIINDQVNTRQNEHKGRFGFFDTIDDPHVSSALLTAAEDWLRRQGMTEIVGPLGFTDLDREGLLTEGFQELSTMATNYNHPYYASLVEAAGYSRETEWLEFVMDVPDSIPEKMDRIAEIVKNRFGLSVRKFSSRAKIKKEYGREIFYLINETYDKLYGYSHLTERQIDAYIDMYLGLLDLDLVSLIVDNADTLVGVGISMPSMSRGLQKSHGKLFPIGWYHLLKGLRGKNDRVDLMLVGVKPEYQNKGVNALLFQDLIPHYIKRGYRWAESNPELADNAAVQDQWKYFKYRRHRKRAAYRKSLK